MKKPLFILAAVIGISSTLLIAQDGKPTEGGPPREGGGPGGRGGQRPMSPIIEALDANKDGTIDADELAKASEALKKLDKNGDGKLTEDEYRPVRPSGGFGGQGGGQGGKGFGGPPGGKGQGGEPGGQEGRQGTGEPPSKGTDGDFVARLFQNDKNKDGKLTKDELPEAMQGIFDRADNNRDGAIDRKEAEAIAARMKQRGGGAGNDGKRPPLEK